MIPKRVIVAMSGGVDSSVAALLLKKEGYDVIGVTLRLWSNTNNQNIAANHRGCCSPEDVDDARQSCQIIGIPHYLLNAEAEFKSHVIDYFVQEYARGRTPHPCLACNDKIKFDFLFGRAQNLGSELIATGHYAKIIKNDNTYELHKADYLDKDQSYVLHMLTSEKLEYIEFPLGTISKPEVRQIAAELGLKTAFKKDSQDICFVGKKDYRNFVNTRVDISSSGEIVDNNGKKIGEHKGVHEFTVGQRKGLPGGQGEAKYVTKIDVSSKKVHIGERKDLLVQNFLLDEVSFVNDIVTNNLTIQTRYNSEDLKCNINEIGNGQLEVTLHESTYGVAPGQFGVIYQGTKLVGGGRISSKVLEKSGNG